jgi:hypothetical protein
MYFIRLEHQSIMKFLTREGDAPKVIHEWMMAVYSDAVPSKY